ncbi:MAG TPA: pyridoxamine 5'-phosphate oxidase family protein [Acidimicrobiales bacterium]|nr:pyridoxamine 5'-phosphate oxidase family protein [Acidimicrobiales bacterium]
MATGDSYLATERTTARRQAARGSFDRDLVHAILDEAWVAHLAVAEPEGPRVLPTTYARVGDSVYVHGSLANRTFRAASGAPVCLAVTLLDGLVLARSAFHHSMNYRSVVVYGVAQPVTEAGEKLRALDAIVERAAPGRAMQCRRPTESELRSTLVLSLPLIEVSAKVRAGGPVDDETDLAWPVWAGVIPLRLVAGDAVPG